MTIGSFFRRGVDVACKGRVPVLAGVILLGLSAQATAVTISTGPFERESGDALYCMFTNQGTKPLDVLFELVDDDGIGVFSSSGTIPPGGTQRLSSGLAQRTYCRFTFDGSKNKVRATGCLTVSGRCTAMLDAR